MDHIQLRRNSLLKSAHSREIDGYLVTSPTNITYLTGFARPGGNLLIVADSTTLIADPQTIARAEKECPGLTFLVHEGTTPIERTAAEVIRKVGIRSLGVEARSLTIESLKILQDALGKTRVVPESGVIENHREIKDASEVEEIRNSTKIAERAFRMFAPQLRETDTEVAMRDALELFLRRAGCPDVAFPTVIAVGDHGAAVDLTPNDTQLVEGSKLLVDFGARLRYRTRLTRTCKTPFMVTPSRKTKRERLEYDIDTVFAAVMSARENALDVLVEGTPLSEVHGAAMSILKEAGLGEFALDMIGHGIGLETVEAPWIRAGVPGECQSGMVICLGVGVSIPGWGAVRLADPVLVTRDRALPLISRPISLNDLL